MNVSSHMLFCRLSCCLGQTSEAGAMTGVMLLLFASLLKQQMFCAWDTWDQGFEWVAGAHWSAAQVQRSLLAPHTEVGVCLSEEAGARTHWLYTVSWGRWPCWPVSPPRHWIRSVCHSFIICFHILFPTVSLDVKQACFCSTVTCLLLCTFRDPT